MVHFSSTVAENYIYVPENYIYLRMHQKQSEEVENTKISWGHAPRPPDAVWLRIQIFIPLPPLTLIKPYFAPLELFPR